MLLHFHHIKNCTGVILAGGENTRMPVLKAFIKVRGEKIIERNLRIMKRLFSETFIVTNQPELYFYLDTPLLGDIYDVRGPLTGIFTSLLNSSNKWAFITACDMPFLDERLMQYMALRRDKCDAVVPKAALQPHLAKEGREDYMEPLFALYSKRLLPLMEKTLLSGKTGPKDFLINKRVKYIRTNEVNKTDREETSFINLNTPEDVKKIKGVMKMQKSKL
ncbi:MAG: molybdenum cofactor guanylyltransferase [Nitrospirae bacterium]|nr:molybdenum cofactor guanylyltransferase [Nitrospirota bacterium]